LGTRHPLKFPRLFAEAFNFAYRFRDLFETCAIVFVIMLVTAIGIRQFEILTTKTRVSEALSLITAYKSDITAFRAQTGRWPETENEKLPVTLLPDYDGLSNRIASMDILDDGVVVARFKDSDDVPESIRGYVLAFRPAVNANDPTLPLTWTCGYWRPPAGLSVSETNPTSFPPQVLPFTCRRQGAQ